MDLMTKNINNICDKCEYKIQCALENRMPFYHGNIPDDKDFDYAQCINIQKDGRTFWQMLL
jgi:hypothetical protein